MAAAPDLTPVEWRPGSAEVSVWSVVGVLVTIFGLALFAIPTLIQHGASVSIRIGLIEVLLIIALTVLLAVMHEAIHGLVMLGFGARPTFGAVMVARVMPVFYATSVGHRFTRQQYLLVAVAPAVLISAIGFALCFAGLTAYLIAPLALHLGGCVGDGGAVLRLMREPPGTFCEDLKDGIRFFRPV